MGKIIRYCMLKEEHNGDNAFIVARPHIMGNPFTHIKSKETKALVKVKTREEAINAYEPYFEKMILIDDNFKKEWDRMFEAYCNYDTIYIGCFCQEHEHCHSDIIIKKLRQRGIKRMVELARKEKGVI